MAQPLDIIQPRIFVRSALLARGVTSDDIQRRIRRKEWAVLRPGAYVGADQLKGLDDRNRHLMLIAASRPDLPADAVLSHSSAALLHGISLWEPNLRTVQVTRPGSGGGHRRQLLHTFRNSLQASEVVTVNGYRATSPARTIVDLARQLSFEKAVVAADSALHGSFATVEDLAHAVASAPRRPGMCNARDAISFADQRTESIGESRSRVTIWRGGLPPPVSQWNVRNRFGQVVGRCDFGWEEFKTVGEFDGAQKYGRLLAPGEPPGDRIYQEKLREDRIRDAGWQVARWTWDELMDGDIVIDRIRRALERGRRMG